jgi:hypothetical protein
MTKKGLFVFFCLVVGLFLGITAAISYVEDPGGVFAENVYECGIATIHLSGHNVSNIENYDEHLL